MCEEGRLVAEIITAKLARNGLFAPIETAALHREDRFQFRRGAPRFTIGARSMPAWCWDASPARG